MQVSFQYSLIEFPVFSLSGGLTCSALDLQCVPTFSISSQILELLLCTLWLEGYEFHFFFPLKISFFCSGTLWSVDFDICSVTIADHQHYLDDMDVGWWNEVETSCTSEADWNCDNQGSRTLFISDKYDNFVCFSSEFCFFFVEGEMT